LYHRIDALLDAITAKRDLRQERREHRRRHETPESYRYLRDETRASEPEPTSLADPNVTPESHIHLRRTP
jgi:hypothetical protein